MVNFWFEDTVLVVQEDGFNDADLLYYIEELKNACQNYLDAYIGTDEYYEHGFLPWDDDWVGEIEIWATEIGTLLGDDISSDKDYVTGESVLYWYTESCGAESPIVWWNGNYVDCVGVELRQPEIFVDDVIPWSWESTNGDAIDDETINETLVAYYAVRYPQIEDKESDEAISMLNPETNLQYGVLDFSHRVWNDLVNKVMKTIIADATKDGYVSSTPEEDWWNTVDDDGNTYIPYSETLMEDTDDDRKLTADRFNSLKFNIGSRIGSGYTENGESKSGTGITNVSSGDIVYGWYLTRLTESLNNLIDYVNSK